VDCHKPDSDINGIIMTKVAPSILSADILHLEDEIKAIEQAGADWLHVDIMDGHFVPNLTFGPKLVREVLKITTLPLDVHLMIDNPESFIEKFAKAGADNITVHCETKVPIPNLYQMVKGVGKSFGVSIKPDTPLKAIGNFLADIDILLIMTVYPGFGGQKFIENVIPKISKAAMLKREKGYHYQIEVDGGLNNETVKTAAGNGAELIVAGEYIFSSADYLQAVTSLRV
jgi:ribulose-phosphate 3-epimerase